MKFRVESFAEAKYSRVAARERPSRRLPEVLQRHRPIRRSASMAENCRGHRKSGEARPGGATKRVGVISTLVIYT